MNSKTEKLKLNKKDVLPFGKHKGEAIKEVLEYDAQYLRWAYDNIDYLYFSTPLLHEIDRKVTEQYVPRQSKSWFNSDEISNYDERQIDCGEGHTW